MALAYMSRGQGDRTDRGHPQGSGKGWRPWKPQCTVAVTGVSERTKKTALQESFGEFGRIIRIEVPDGKTVAFVEYEEKRDANDAIDCMNGKAIEGRRIGVRLVEDLPPKIDRNAPKQEEVVHAPAEGRANFQGPQANQKNGTRSGRERSGSPGAKKEGRKEDVRSPSRRRSRSRRENGGHRKRSRRRSGSGGKRRGSRSADRRSRDAGKKGKERSRSRDQARSRSRSRSRKNGKATKAKAKAASRSRSRSRSRSKGERRRKSGSGSRPRRNSRGQERNGKRKKDKGRGSSGSEEGERSPSPKKAKPEKKKVKKSGKKSRSPSKRSGSS